MTSNATLLIVDDEPHVLSSIKRLLRAESYQVLTATSAGKGLDLLAHHNICVTLSDHMMPDMDGITFLEKVAAHDPAIVRILITAHASLENAMAAIKRGRIFEYLTKPWSDTSLKRVIRRAFEHYDLLEENRHLQELTRQQNEELKTINDNLESLVKTRTEQLEGAVREGVFMLAVASEAKDDVTGGHIHRIQRLTYDICRAQGFSEAQAETISFGSILHDVGKIHIPDAILKKKGPSAGVNSRSCKPTPSPAKRFSAANPSIASPARLHATTMNAGTAAVTRTDFPAIPSHWPPGSSPLQMSTTPWCMNGPTSRPGRYKKPCR